MPSFEDRTTPVVPDFELEPPKGEIEVVVVDDHLETLRAVKRHLDDLGWSVRGFTDPAEALEAIRESSPAVLLTDFDMPGMTGLQLVEETADADADVRTLIMTGRGDEATAQSALRAGVDDYLTKPLSLAEVERAIRRCVARRQQIAYSWKIRAWLEAEVRRQTQSIRELSVGAIRALGTALEARSEYFRGHSEGVALCADGIAQQLGLSEKARSAIRTAGLLHDIGMIGVSDSIVEKPGELTGEEYAEVQAHCEKGAAILELMPHLRDASRFVLEHHERWDGSGYPFRKSGKEISRGGLIIGLAETWTALAEPRPYREQTSPREAIRMLEKTSGAWYPAEIIDALTAMHRLKE